jgi:hypothetical protein
VIRLRIVLATAALILTVGATPLVVAPSVASAADHNFGLPTVQLLTPTSGAGVHPTLKWKPVSGAATYRVVVRNRKGKVAWAWSGPATSVVMSATTKPVGRRPGQPRLTPSSSWTVAAFDANGKAVALSRARAISP